MNRDGNLVNGFMTAPLMMGTIGMFYHFGQKGGDAWGDI